MGVLKVRTDLGWEATNGGVDHAYVDNAHWSSAWGHIADFPRLVANSIAVNTVQPVTQDLSITLQAGRRYRAVISLRAVTVSAAGSATITLKDGTTMITGHLKPQGNQHAYTAVNYGHLNAQWIIDGAGQTYTQLHFEVQWTNGTVHVESPSQFYIEDIGPITRLPDGALPPDPDWVAQDARYINASGDQMFGELLLPGTSTHPMAAIPRDYVDRFSFDSTPEIGRYSGVAGISSPLSFNAGWGHFTPTRCPPCAIDALAIEVTTAAAAGGVCRLGIYANHPTRIEPLTLLKDAGTVSTTTLGVKTITFAPTSFLGGWLWLAVAAQTAACTIAGAIGFGEPWVMYGVGQVPPALSYRSWTSPSFAGAFPSTITDLGLSVSSNPKIAFRTA